MFKYLVKNNKTNERFECKAKDFEELKENCKFHFGTDDILVIKKEDMEDDYQCM